MFISSFYLTLTVINKIYIDSVFRKTLKEKNIDSIRFQAQPSIFNNILWYGIAETEDHYYAAYYSLFDRKTEFSNWQKLPKNHELLPMEHPDVQTLAWFSNHYFNVIQMEEQSDQYRYNDLRYPLLNADDPNSSVFSFTIYKDGERWNVLPFSGKPPSREDFDILTWFINFHKI